MNKQEQELKPIEPVYMVEYVTEYRWDPKTGDFVAERVTQTSLEWRGGGDDR